MSGPKAADLLPAKRTRSQEGQQGESRLSLLDTAIWPTMDGDTISKVELNEVEYPRSRQAGSFPLTSPTQQASAMQRQDFSSNPAGKKAKLDRIRLLILCK
jgi:hypothetical protein